MDEVDRELLKGILNRYKLKDIVATLSTLCYEQATEIRETLGAQGRGNLGAMKARDWVKAANYLMGTSVNTNITDV